MDGSMSKTIPENADDPRPETLEGEIDLRAAVARLGGRKIKMQRYVESYDIDTDITTVRVEMTYEIGKK